jgi:hypothetical protein
MPLSCLNSMMRHLSRTVLNTLCYYAWFNIFDALVTRHRFNLYRLTQPLHIYLIIQQRIVPLSVALRAVVFVSFRVPLRRGEALCMPNAPPRQRLFSKKMHFFADSLFPIDFAWIYFCLFRTHCRLPAALFGIRAQKMQKHPHRSTIFLPGMMNRAPQRPTLPPSYKYPTHSL